MHIGGFNLTNQIKKLTISGILLSVGFILHQIMPAGLGTVTFDFMLAVLFIVIMINKDLKTVMIAGICAGIITALTTKFPGGQLPNLVDKTLTASIVFLLMQLTKGLPETWKLGLLGFLGTMVSGAIFLGSASFLAGLPASFRGLFISVVLPTAIGNTILTIFLYKIVVRSLERVNPALLKQLHG